MVSCFISRIVILIFGTLYPAYSSYKAVRTKNVREYVKWMMYWIVFALFTSIETLTDLFLSFWFPFYYELKILIVIYLLSPATNGSSILYRKFVHPILARREQEIDDYIAKAKEQGYHTMLNLGSKGVTYATSLIMQTAIKGGGGLVSHLKKSYSLGDLSEDQTTRQGRDCRDGFDYRHFENAPIMHFAQSEVPSRLSYRTQNQLPYAPDVIGLGDMPSHSMTDDEYFGPLPSNDVNSRYSSGDPYYYGSPLVRTGSLGPTTRIRTRASAKTALSKKGSLPEGVPARSLEEMTESQREPDERCLVPLTHSSSLPVSFTAINHVIKPDYQKVFSQLSPDQFLALLESAKAELPQSSEGKGVEIATRETTSDKSKEASEKDEKDSDKSKRASEKDEKDSSEKDTAQNVETDKSIKPKVVTPKETAKVEKSAGKPTKRPAPSPPIKPNIIETAEGETEEFVTPSSSPKLSRKLSYTNLVEMIMDEKLNKDVAGKEDEAKSGSKLKVPEKVSRKKSKKLHIPKMSFSFWSSKSKGHSSGSDNSSVASNENLPGATPSTEKTDLEYFVPLKSESTADNHPSGPDEPFD